MSEFLYYLPPDLQEEYKNTMNVVVICLLSPLQFIGIAQGLVPGVTTCNI
jgi:hypothetical protein